MRILICMHIYLYVLGQLNKLCPFIYVYNTYKENYENEILFFIIHSMGQM